MPTLSFVPCIAEVSMDRIRLDTLQDTCDFFGPGLDLDIYFWKKNWIRTGSGYLFDFYNEIFLRVIQDVTNAGAVIFFPMIFIFTKKSKWFCQCVLHSSQSMLIHVTSLQIFSGELELASCSYVAGMLLFVLLCWVAYVCVV